MPLVAAGGRGWRSPVGCGESRRGGEQDQVNGRYLLDITSFPRLYQERKNTLRFPYPRV
jgi:hypothetical protein